MRDHFDDRKIPRIETEEAGVKNYQAECRRDRLDTILFNRAAALEREAMQLRELAKTVSSFSNVIEAELYPYVTGYFNMKDRYDR